MGRGDQTSEGKRMELWVQGVGGGGAGGRRRQGYGRERQKRGVSRVERKRKEHTGLEDETRSHRGGPGAEKRPRAGWRQEGSSTLLAHGPPLRDGEGQRQLQKREVESAGGPTLAVHAHGIKQAGATKLGAEKGHVQLQEPGLAVVS